MGKACHGNARQQLAQLLQGIEAEMLQQMIKPYRGEMLIIQHDGFTLSSFIGPRETN